MLLVLKMEGVTSQRIYVASRIWKRQRSNSPLDHLERISSADILIFSLVRHLIFRTVRELCGNVL